MKKPRTQIAAKPAETELLHDINNVLASLSLSAEMLARGMAGPLTKEQKEYLAQITDDAKKIEKLLKKLRAIVYKK